MPHIIPQVTSVTTVVRKVDTAIYFAAPAPEQARTEAEKVMPPLLFIVAITYGYYPKELRVMRGKTLCGGLIKILARRTRKSSPQA